MSVFITQDMVTQAVNDVVAKLGKLNLEELARVLHMLETTDFNPKMTTDFNQYKYHRI